MLEEARVTFEEDDFYKKGSYNKITLYIRKEDSYINATKIDKDVRNYLGQKTWPKVVIYWLENVVKGEPKATHTLTDGPSEHRGIFIHPDLIHFIAEWHSLEYTFAVKRIMDVVNQKFMTKTEESKHLFVMYPDTEDGYFKISTDNSKIPKYYKCFTFPTSTYVKQALENYIGKESHYPMVIFENILEFIRAHDINSTEEPPPISPKAIEFE
jgi:hypothetical protein